jgi:transketolase
MDINRAGLTKDPLALRFYYTGALKELMEKNPDICVGEADVANGMWKPDLEWLRDTYTDRVFDVGIQEGNLVGVAAGMCLTGKIPYIHTFAPFITRRAYDIIFVSGAYAKLNIRLIGSDPGVTAAYNGGTHMTFEDVGIMRNIPDITIVDITDGAMLRNAILQSAEAQGMFYFRFARGRTAAAIYDERQRFAFGKANVLTEGDDVSVIACGIMVEKALEASALLKKKGISARVVDIHTIKPLDKACVLRCAAETGALVTAENHSVINGLGSAVASVLATESPCPLGMVGVRDEFGEVGDEDYLIERFGLRAEDIANCALRTLERKRKAR